MNQQRLDEFGELLYEVFRHLSKQDTLEDGGLFNQWPDDGSPWNNDTVVFALQTICELWLADQGAPRALDYVRIGHGIVRPIPQTLREIGILPAADDSI